MICLLFWICFLIDDENTYIDILYNNPCTHTCSETRVLTLFLSNLHNRTTHTYIYRYAIILWHFSHLLFTRKRWATNNNIGSERVESCFILCFGYTKCVLVYEKPAATVLRHRTPKQFDKKLLRCFTRWKHYSGTLLCYIYILYRIWTDERAIIVSVSFLQNHEKNQPWTSEFYEFYIDVWCTYTLL